MSRKTTVFMITAWSLLALTGPVRGQEVNSDVKIPPPREIVAGVMGASGLFSGAVSFLVVPDQVFQGVVSGTVGERETRDELGDFMASLLVRAGIISFDARPAARDASGQRPDDGSRPAWTGPAPMALSVGWTRRAESMRRR